MTLELQFQASTRTGRGGRAITEYQAEKHGLLFQVKEAARGGWLARVVDIESGCIVTQRELRSLTVAKTELDRLDLEALDGLRLMVRKRAAWRRRFN